MKQKPMNNTSDGNLEVIESERDLEDFAPLVVELPLPLNDEGYPELPEGAHFSFRAKNININLYRGVWETGDDYLKDMDVMKNQVKQEYDVDGDGDMEQMYLFKIGEGHLEKNLDQDEINDYFGKSRSANFIFEGYKTSPASCVENPQDCYLELALMKGGETLGLHKIYMQLYDVKQYYDHYSVGEGWGGDNRLVSSHYSVHENSYKYININEGKDEGYQNEYIMFVHGWRMKNSERVSFGETAFKRLYRSGYKGRFGLYSWPTGWFDLPAHEYNLFIRAAIAALHAQNYGDSEVIARAAGGLLSNLLTNIGAENRLHIFAHSMGNVVVSEALRNANGIELVNHYIASQAAEVASAYNPYSDWMDYQSFGATAEGVEAAWRSLNVGSGIIATE